MTQAIHQPLVAVYCGSRSGHQPHYQQMARQLGQALALAGFGLVYGGASIGLMGQVADAVLAVTGWDPGLMLTGTAAALMLVYSVRFFGVAQGAVDAAFGRISPSLPMAARSLGRTPGGALRAVHLPLMRGSVATALLVVFVDCVKELPATLLLRPFNYNTLATRVFELASLERLEDAAPAALMVMAVGLLAVALMARANR